MSKGRQNEIRKELTLRLDGVEKIVTVGELSIGDDAFHVQVQEAWSFLKVSCIDYDRVGSLLVNFPRPL